MLPCYPSDGTIVIEERWRDRLWSAIPHRVVRSTPTVLVTEIPARTTGVYASNRDLPEAAGLTRDQRKLAALESLVYEPVAREITPRMLHVIHPDRWSRVNLGWDETGQFIGWYVNFERPATITPYGLATMDLVLDILIKPDHSWDWKDADDLDEAIARGIHPAELRSQLNVEKDRVLADLDTEVGAFDPRWIDHQPDAEAALPVLPADYAVGGSLWQVR